MKCLEVCKKDLSSTRWIDSGSRSLEPGEVRLKLREYSLTANNVSYGLAGDSLGYWQFFPAADALWGRVPVMGIAEVVDSRCEAVPCGRTVWGWFPMCSDLVVLPSATNRYGFVDGNPERGDNASIYRRYEFFELDELSSYRMSLKGLFTTSWLFSATLGLDAFGMAEQVVVTSASSKTALALAYELRASPLRVVGITSNHNREFVISTGLYDSVLTYNDIADVECQNTVVVDFSGDSACLDRLSEALGPNLLHCGLIGATRDLPKKGGVQSEKRAFFFAPHAAEALAKNGKYNPATINQSLGRFAQWISMHLDIDRRDFVTEGNEAWQEVLSNRVKPSVLLVVSSCDNN